jgi:hypothetical protein
MAYLRGAIVSIGVLLSSSSSVAATRIVDLSGSGEFTDIQAAIDGLERSLPDFIVEAPDCHLQTGSPAIDAGTAEGTPISDIEGHGRPCGAGVDIGAYETGDCEPGSCGDLDADYDEDGVKNRDEDTNGDGICSDDDTDGDGVLCQKAVDANDDGAMDASDAVFLLGYLFLEGEGPNDPHGTCGMDPTPEDGLTCRSFPSCR